jgi:chromosome partitioning protein
MAARIIAVANQKGGSGKTLVSMSTAASLVHRGHKVLVVDADDQGTATQWAGAAAEGKPFPATVISLASSKAKLHQLLKPMVEDYDFIVIDCPPSVNEQSSQSAMLIADVCLIPLRPTPSDMWATVGILDLVHKAQALNPSLQAFGVANSVSTSTLGKQVLAMVAETGIVMLDSKLGNRTSFQEATIVGSTPQKMGAGHKVAAAEVESLVSELLSKMGWSK